MGTDTFLTAKELREAKSLADGVTAGTMQLSSFGSSMQMAFVDRDGILEDEPTARFRRKADGLFFIESRRLTLNLIEEVEFRRAQETQTNALIAGLEADLHQARCLLARTGP